MSDLTDKRVLIVLPSIDNMGGAERQALYLARGLRLAGAYVEVWGPGTLGRVAEECTALDIIPSTINLELKGGRLKLWWNLRRFKNRLRTGRFDWLIPFANAPNVYCGLVWQSVGIKACVWNQRDEGKNLGRKRVRQAIENIDLFLSNSAHAAQILEQRFTHTKGKTRVVRNGITASTAKVTIAEVRAELGVGSSAPLVIMLGNITNRKRQDVLVKAWKTVAEKRPDARLVLAGYHSNRATEVLTLIQKLGLSQSILTPGSISDVGSLIHAADLCAFSSDKEGCPNGVLECMAAGLPIVATDIPGIREIFNSDEFLVPKDDPIKFAERILYVLENKTLADDLGQQNRAIVESGFSVEGMVQNTINAYLELEADYSQE
ncbi:MAG: glycosyltransferase family 4 protein [Planctomycetes bacterium]|nr:glycosyltransferase family 4 protein [Planctomycetota bacterium]